MTHQFLVDAITNQQVLTFTYDGLPRTVEPHAYGVSTAGNDVLRCYQTAGQSNEGPVPGWRLMTVAKIVAMQPSGETFPIARPGYRRGDRGMTRIYAQI